ncbi:hypothetical protein TNCV_4304611 [Trichonephila clavipes]|nr:hypothetical protein TNCV_4304611 [Trichonephila clavipes]
MKVIPTTDMTAETVCRALLSVWISRFGCPAIITTDQGTNFESSLFRELSNLLGTNRIRCCAYHPKANGLVERLHRHLKSAIKAHENSKWSEIIPIVLLGMRSAVKKDINATCAELVYGTTLRLPSDLFSTDKITTTCNQTYVSFLREKIRALQPIPTSSHSNSSMFVPTNLKSCSHVFLRVDSVQPPLSQNYTGLHEVIRRTDKVFTILINGKRKAVSIDRVKPAYVWNDTDDIPLTGISKQQADETDPHSKDKTMAHVNKTESQPNEKTVKKTRSGRHKDELKIVAGELNLTVPESAKITGLKSLIVVMFTKKDKELVHSAINYALAEIKNKRLDSETKLEFERIKLAQLQKQLELANIQKNLPQNSDIRNPSVFETADNNNVETLLKSVKTLTILVPSRVESYNLFFQSLEKAFKIKEVPEQFKCEILLNILGERVNNLLVHVSEEELNNYMLTARVSGGKAIFASRAAIEFSFGEGERPAQRRSN